MASDEKQNGHHLLGELPATAICGNDITSSCLYVSALATMAAGRLAPMSLLIVAAVLFLFRKIYSEVVVALPLNGGAYNALLNTTSKFRASIAACLTLLSYMATAVISAVEAMHYAHSLWDGLPVIAATIVLLAVFMVLTIVGITESARVAIVIFLTHLVTLVLLLILGLVFLWSHGTDNLKRNLAREEPLQRQLVVTAAELPPADDDVIAGVESDLNDGHVPDALRIQLRKAGLELPTEVNVERESPGTWRIEDPAGGGQATVRIPQEKTEANEEGGDTGENTGGGRDRLVLYTDRGLLVALFFGFCAAMLGISGFESSANFVEEQQDGVFPKTLRNMWMAVSILNPSMALLTLALIPVEDVGFHKDHLLAHLGWLSGGTWMKTLISIDAALVLSGAVLTSYVGVNGLVHRMTLDRCLPQFLLKTNRRGTTHRIIIGFFLLAVSVLLITRGKLEALAGVYTLSFLAVMVLFAVGNILLKVKRARLPRPIRAPWPYVLTAIAAVLAALVGIAVENPDYLMVFLSYFIPTLLVVMVMLGRIGLLKTCLGAVRAISTSLGKMLGNLSRAIIAKIDEINAQQVVFFTRGDNTANLNNAILYVKRNEHTSRIKVVTVVEDEKHVPAKLRTDLEILDEAYPDIDIEFVAYEGTFSPALIHHLSKEWNVPKNLMFIGSHGEKFKYDQAVLGGVRLIV